MKILILFDDFSLEVLKNGAPPRTSMSHDQNLFQLASVALEAGHKVYFNSIANYVEGASFELLGVRPSLKVGTSQNTLASLEPDLLVCNHPQVFAWDHAPYAKKLAIHPALYFIEMPYLIESSQTRAQLISARHHIDFIAVQNDRMKEIVSTFYGWLAGWNEPDRILVNPLLPPEQTLEMTRIDARKVMNVRPDEVLITNGGGIWRWTGFNDFLRGFIKAARRKDNKLVLALSGFKQDENADHGDYITETHQILEDNADLVGNRRAGSNTDCCIHVESSWEEGAKNLKLLYAASDFGLNVNQNGFENWQAHRVRCLDYISHNLPILSTRGDGLTASAPTGAVTFIPSLEPDDIVKTLLDLTKKSKLRSQAVAKSRIWHERLKASSATADLLSFIEKTPRRKIDLDRTTLLEAIWKTETKDIVDRSLQRIGKALGL